MQLAALRGFEIYGVSALMLERSHSVKKKILYKSDSSQGMVNSTIT
jgi:hypothetical protein